MIPGRSTSCWRQNRNTRLVFPKRVLMEQVVIHSAGAGWSVQPDRNRVRIV